jgi:hypothetical protein
MFKRTTGEVAVEHSTPLTIAVDADTVWPRAAHALDTGIVGGVEGDAGVDEPPPPPHAASTSAADIAAGIAIRMVSP